MVVDRPRPLRWWEHLVSRSEGSSEFPAHREEVEAMICSGCGKDIPFVGEVCPYCHREKKSDQAQQMHAMFFGTLGAAIGAAIGYGENKEVGWLIGGFIGMVAGVVSGLIQGRDAVPPESKPPEVRLAPDQHVSATVEVKNPIPLRRKGTAREVEDLGRLLLQGVITAEEFERGKAAILGSPPDKAAAAVDLLRKLGELKAQGILSESEFNAKKWEVLSERLMPGSRQAATLWPGPRATGPSPVAASSVSSSVPCPLCGKRIPEKAIRHGLNACPHCRGTYEAEVQ